MQNEKRLIDLNCVIEQLENEWGYEGIREDLYKLPTVDVVEVVRCRDCKWYDLETEHCTFWGELWGGYHDPNGYCDEGDRRKEQNDE